MPKRSWLLLLAALALLPWTALQGVVAIAIWLAPACLLRYSRTESSTPRAGLLVGLVYSLAIFIQLRGQFLPVSLGLLLAVALSTALVRTIPYLLDRWLSVRLRPMSRSLVFPVAMTGMEFLATRYGPYGSWGATGYSQYYDLPLIQIVSLTGLAGLTFLVHWIAPVINALIEAGGDFRRYRGVAMAYGAALVLTLGYGGIRLALADSDPETVSAATVVPSEAEYRGAFGDGDVIALAQADEGTRRAAALRFNQVSDSLLAATARAARLGARIVAWPEYIPVLEEDHDQLVERARATARAERIYLMITPLTIRRTNSFPYVANVSIMLDTVGEIRWRYAKTFPVVGMETGAYEGSNGIIPVISTPYGRLSAAICQDLDFPYFIRRVGFRRADILIGPADDWPQIRETHAQMEIFRSVEYGISLLRPTNNGISEAVDPYGRVLAVSGSTEGRGRLMLAELPTQRVFTLYTKLGDWFGWCSVAGMIAFIALIGVPMMDGRTERRMDG